MAGGSQAARMLIKLGIALFADKGTLEEDMDEINKKAAEAAKKSEEWGNTMSKAFKSVTKPLDKIIPGLSNVAGALGKAIGGSKAFSASLGIMKTAIIGTGIGALVIALTSLVSWLTSTVKGADAVNKVLQGIKSVIQTVIKRLAALGEAIILLFKGEFKEAAKKAKEAVSGFGEEVRENYREGLALGERSNQQKKDAIALTYQETDAESRLDELRRTANDETKTYAERLAAVSEMKKIQNNLDAQKVAMATEAYDIAKKENAQGTMTYAKMEEEAKLYQAMIKASDAKSSNLNSINELQKSITAEAAKEKAERDKLAASTALAAEKAKNMAEIKPLTDMIKLPQIGKLAPEIDTTKLMEMKPISLVPKDTEEWKKYWEAVDALAAESQQKRLEIATTGMESMSSLLDSVSQLYTAAMNKELTAAGDNEQKKDEIRKKYAKKQKTVAIMQAIINGALGITKAFADLGPIAGAIAAALVAVSTIAQIAVIKSQPLAKGGIATRPTLAMVGEYPNARSNPEIIAPLDKLKGMLGNPFGNTLYGEVRVDGQDLLIAISNAQKIKAAY